MQGCAYVDGQYIAPEDAKISIFDWGFLHSDATYDVAHVWQGLDDHLDRFDASLKALRLDTGHTREQLRTVMHECVRRAGLREAYVEVLCTRGRPAPGSRDPRTCRNTFMAFAIPFVWIADPDKQRRGIDLIVGTPARIGAGSVDPRIKNYHWLDFVMGLFEAYERGGETVVLTDGRGHVTHHVAGLVGSGIGRRGAAGKAAQVGRDAGGLGRQALHHLVPHEGGLGEAVQQHHAHPAFPCTAAGQGDVESPFVAAETHPVAGQAQLKLPDRAHGQARCASRRRSLRPRRPGLVCSTQRRN